MSPEERKSKKEKYEKKIELVYPEWERQTNESPRSFEAYKYYRDMGYTRSLYAVAQKFTKDNLKSKYQVVLIWSYKFRWNERIACYQKYIDSIYLEETKNAIKEMAHRHSEYAKQTMQALYVPIMEFAKKYNLINDMKKTAIREGIPFNNNEADIDTMKLSQLIALVQKSAPLIDVMADMERKARGEPTLIATNDLTSNGNEIKADIKVVVNGSKSNLMKEYEFND